MAARLLNVDSRPHARMLQECSPLCLSPTVRIRNSSQVPPPWLPSPSTQTSGLRSCPPRGRSRIRGRSGSPRRSRCRGSQRSTRSGRRSIAFACTRRGRARRPSRRHMC
eukprot:5157453-Alexandrium_andersonii.AAC.1